MMIIGGTTGTPDNATRSYKVVAAVIVIAFVLLAGRLWHLQVLRGDTYFRKSADNFVKELDIPAPRGDIRDRKGHVLVDNRPSWNIYVTPRFLTIESLDRVAKVLKADPDAVAQIRARAAVKKGLDRYQQILAFEDVGRDEMAALQSERNELPGITVDARSHRHYPYNKLGAHILGYMNQISPEELVELRDQGYHPGDYIGRAGVERQWESYLRGKDGFERIIVDAKGHTKTHEDAAEVFSVVEGPMRRDPVPGNNLVLSLDLDLQRTAEKALARYPSAAAVAIEVRTGRVLALASHPAFDPNVLTGRLTRAEDERLQKDPFRPMIDKALRENYFPGSTFKIIPALAALQDHFIDDKEKMKCTSAYQLPGHTFRCMEVHGPINLHDAIVESCNIFFYHLAERVGMDRMARLASEFGFGAATGIGLPGEVPGFIPTHDWYEKQGGFRIGYTLNTAIGQGSTKVTLIQLALAYAALANGGDLYVPQLVDHIETPSGRVVQSFDTRLRHHIDVSKEHLDFVRHALCGVVNDIKGTAYSSRDGNLPVEVCGKTGTAQVRKNRKGEVPGWDTGNDHAWFASFAPPNKPELAVVVLVEHGGLGGKVAAPIAMDIYRGFFNQKEKAAALDKAALDKAALEKAPALDNAAPNDSAPSNSVEESPPHAMTSLTAAP